MQWSTPCTVTIAQSSWENKILMYLLKAKLKHKETFYIFYTRKLTSIL